MRTKYYRSWSRLVGLLKHFSMIGIQLFHKLKERNYRILITNQFESLVAWTANARHHTVKYFALIYLNAKLCVILLLSITAAKLEHTNGFPEGFPNYAMLPATITRWRPPVLYRLNGGRCVWLCVCAFRSYQTRFVCCRVQCNKARHQRNIMLQTTMGGRKPHGRTDVGRENSINKKEA